MGAYDSRIKLEALRDHFETFGKGANYLLVGHGAGLVGCLSVLKDHPEHLPPQFTRLGQLILLFGAGLLFSSLFWFMSMLIKIKRNRVSDPVLFVFAEGVAGAAAPGGAPTFRRKRTAGACSTWGEMIRTDREPRQQGFRRARACWAPGRDHE
jgi:hypothetical protein